MASNILGKISKERTVSAVVIVIAALAAILPGGIILAAVLDTISRSMSRTRMPVFWMFFLRSGTLCWISVS